MLSVRFALLSSDKVFHQLSYRNGTLDHLTARFVLSDFPRIEENPLTISTHWRTSARASSAPEFQRGMSFDRESQIVTPFQLNGKTSLSFCNEKEQAVKAVALNACPSPTSDIVKTFPYGLKHYSTATATKSDNCAPFPVERQKGHTVKACFALSSMPLCSDFMIKTLVHHVDIIARRPLRSPIFSLCAPFVLSLCFRMPLFALYCPSDGV